ncbi:helix-turn-helix domain-containing protein [Paenibacillus larvae]
MLIFMDKLALRKIKLLELLSLENREFNIIEISSYLGCTDRTVLKTIQCLKVDFESWKDNIEIINRDNKFIYLKKSIYFSLELIQLNYLKNSLTFNACNDIFDQVQICV